MSSMRRLANISTHLNGPVTTNTVASEEEYKAALIECRAALAAFMDKMNANPIFVRLAWHDSGTYDKEVRVFAYCPKRVPLPHTRRLPSACAPKCHTPLSRTSPDADALLLPPLPVCAPCRVSGRRFRSSPPAAAPTAPSASSRRSTTAPTPACPRPSTTSSASRRPTRSSRGRTSSSSLPPPPSRRPAARRSR